MMKNEDITKELLQKHLLTREKFVLTLGGDFLSGVITHPWFNNYIKNHSKEEKENKED